MNIVYCYKQNQLKIRFSLLQHQSPFIETSLNRFNPQSALKQKRWQVMLIKGCVWLCQGLTLFFHCRSLSAPLVPKRTLPRFGLQVHPDQPQDGPFDRQSGLYDRTHKRATLFTASKWTHHVGRPVWSVLPDWRGRVHMCPLRVHATARQKSEGQLQRQTENRTVESVQILRDDDLLQLKNDSV